MPPSPHPGRVASADKPPRVYRRTTEKLTRKRLRHGDLSSRTLYFTFPGGPRAYRSQVTFVWVENVPEFEGEDGWFEMELVAGKPKSYWRAARQVEAPR